MKIETKKIFNKKTMKKALFAALLGNAVSVAVLYACSILLWQGNLPETLLSEYVLGATFAGAIASGAAFAKGDKSLVKGALGGIMYITLLTLISIYRAQADVFDTDYLKILICSIAGGAFGGIMVIGKRTKKRRSGGKGYTNSNHKKKVT